MKKSALFLLFLISTPLFGVEMMDVDDVEPGMTGVGYSVFRGWEPEEFQVEIIDVMLDYFMGGDLILANLSGAGLEETGVIAGMSGSPVYIDGKLIGAVAYTWSYCKTPLAGITPISLMLDQKENADLDYFDGEFQRIALPIAVSGFSDTAMDFLQTQLGEAGFSVTASPGGGSMAAPENETLEGGDAVAIKMVDGDYDMAGTGTVTYVDGDDVYIYGHPFYSMGNISYPICRSYVYTSIPSLELSSKLAATSETIGSTVFDGRNAVYCELGRSPEMVPMHIDVETPQNSESFDCTIIPDSTYFSTLASSVISSSMEAVMGEWDDKTVGIYFTIDCTADGEDFVITNNSRYALSPSYYTMELLLSDISAYFTTITGSDYSEITINNVDVDVVAEDGVIYYSMDTAETDKDLYFAGETMTVTVNMTSYLDAPRTEIFEIELPEDLVPGLYTVYVGSELSVNNDLISLFPYLYEIESVEDLIKVANLKSDYSLLQAAFVSFNEGSMISGVELSALPEAYISLLGKTNPNNDMNYAFPEIYSDEIDLGNPVYGSEEIEISIRVKSASEVD